MPILCATAPAPFCLMDAVTDHLAHAAWVWHPEIPFSCVCLIEYDLAA